MKFADALIAAGVAPSDIDDAIRRSRRVVRRASSGARFVASALEAVGSKAPDGTKTKAVALIGSMWLDRIAEQTESMLRPRGKR